MIVNIIGAGLAGCEAANFLANKGIKVRLFEKRPKYESPAHHTDLFGELVCSNSLKNKKLDNACGLLKEEIRLMGSLMMEAALKSEVPGGDSLTVDREEFAKYITEKIKSNPNIEIVYEDVNDFKDGINIVCTGPLTSSELLNKISDVTGEKNHSFFDASAPIIDKNSIDFSKVFYKSRYNQGDDSYINCPMTKEEYLNFYNELINAKLATLHAFDTKYFEGCLPIEVIASRGVDTLRYGPLKPKGLEHDGNEYYAVVQLRQDDLIGNFYNMVGFQTNLTYPEQKRVFSLIPGLENAKFVRYGLMHRNSYIYAPRILTDYLNLKVNENVYIAGQLSGVEGYVESAASGLLAAYYVYFRLKNIEFKPISFFTVLGALIRYITKTGINTFSPMNANFGIIYRGNVDKKEVVIERSLKEVKKFISQLDE
ncbi:MAG: methylenetetrahydrofolate--tRNA-(uracil(54)-C(5))-methyltransferase (FADH(2)-oxidizing) TrmFO [Bacilli bacterium]|nr:methylenetetrahydrofolate--tRNA-(uracil(54)-C(5))-methyltransferase (FADH(2)-oxidizing) TrmFO [Bacilli bacterium]